MVLINTRDSFIFSLPNRKCDVMLEPERGIREQRRLRKAEDVYVCGREWKGIREKELCLLSRNT
jgi:hypothetical protein